MAASVPFFPVDYGDMSLLKLADSTGNDRSRRHQHPCCGQLHRSNRARGPMSGIHESPT